jgi:hypothetical protein
MLMGLWDFELLNINGFFSFHEEFMQDGITVSDIIFVEAEDLPMLSQQPLVIIFVFGRHLQFA